MLFRSNAKALPDMVLKIGELSIIDTTNFYFKTTLGTSFFYWLSLFENKKLYCKLETLDQKESATKSLWVASTIDVVSPPSVYFKFIKKLYPKSDFMVVEDVLHGDLLNSNRVDAAQMECFFLQR